jgi:AcrR family transcriptional regulator
VYDNCVLYKKIELCYALLMKKMKTDPPSTLQASPKPGIIWARSGSGKRGLRPSLSREQIVRAAIDIADMEGIETLSIRRIASKLGVSTMALYWYAASKDDVLDLMIDAVYAEIRFPPQPSADWRADCTELARHVRNVMRRHPWLAALSSNRPLLGPNALKLHEYLLATLSLLGLNPRVTLGLAEIVGAYLRGFVQKELGEAEAQRRSGLSKDEWRVSVAPYIHDHVIASGHYPHLAYYFSHVEEWDDEKRFDFGLDFLLDSISTQALHLRGAEHND